MSTVRETLLTAIASFGTCLVAVAGQISFTGIGGLPGTPPISFTNEVSPDGGTVVGNAGSPPGFSTAGVRWTRAGGLQSLGLPPGITYSNARAVSTGGDVIAGYHQSPERYAGYRWTESGGFVDMGDLPGGTNSTVPLDISWDGNTIVGLGNFGFSPGGSVQGEGFIWTAAKGIRSVGVLEGGATSQALAVSADGSKAVGYADEPGAGRAFWWTEEQGMRVLADLPGGTESASAAEISADGRFIAGASVSANGFEACLWAEEGSPIGLGDLPGGPFRSVSEGVTNDGSVVVGYSTISNAGAERAFIWDAAHGMRDLRTVLRTEFGLPLTGWTLTRANAITPDGSVIVGDGINPRGDFEGWVAVVPEPGAVGATFLFLVGLRLVRRERGA